MARERTLRPITRRWVFLKTRDFRNLELRLCDLDELPIPGLPTAVRPFEGERLRQSGGFLHCQLGQRSAGPSEGQSGAESACAVGQDQGAFFSLNVAGEELGEDLRHVGDHILFVMSPAIAIFGSDELPDPRPLALFHRLQEVALMQPDLPGGLPKQAEVDHNDERAESEQRAQTFSIHQHE